MQSCARDDVVSGRTPRKVKTYSQSEIKTVIMQSSFTLLQMEMPGCFGRRWVTSWGR